MLSKKYGNDRLEIACELASENIRYQSYKNIKNILLSDQDVKFSVRKEEKKKNKINSNSFLRGSDYYGGTNNE